VAILPDGLSEHQFTPKSLLFRDDPPARCPGAGASPFLGESITEEDCPECRQTCGISAGRLMWHTLADGSDCVASGYTSDDAMLISTASRT
jgi:hypothetical protein